MAQSDNDRLVTELGQAILADANYVERDWVGIALVFQLGERRRTFGYVYDADGSWEAETPSTFDIIGRADALRTAMIADGKPAWKMCLVQLRRPGPKLTIDFEYDDATRWAVTPANLDARVEELRPAPA